MSDQSDPVQESEDTRKRDDAEYAKFRESCQKASDDAGGSFDKTLLAVSGSALAFSAAFVKDIAAKKSGTSLVLLSICLVTMLVSMGMLLLNMHLAFCAAQRHKQIADQCYADYTNSSRFWTNVTTRIEREAWENRAIKRINVLSLVLSGIGLASLISFLFIYAWSQYG